MRQTLVIPDVPPPAGAYSHAVRAGDFLFISGQVPRSADGTYIPGTVGDETRLALENLSTIAQAAGADLQAAVKITAYLAEEGYFAAFNESYSRYFRDAPPARTTLVAGLRQVKVEIDAIIYLAVSAPSSSSP